MVRVAVEREHRVLGQHGEDPAVGGGGGVGAERCVQDFVCEIGRSSDERPSAEQGPQRKRVTAGSLAADERPQRPALKGDRVAQSGTTSMPFQKATRFLILRIHG